MQNKHWQVSTDPNYVSKTSPGYPYYNSVQ